MMFKNAINLFDLFGFKIRVDPSWLLIAALIIWSLSNAYFPEILPGYSNYEYIALGTASMLGLFASLIFHELSHSLVARQFGLKVGSITLFIFGGVAELEHEPKSPKSEFWIAIAGPAMSFALAGLFYLAAVSIEGIQASKPLAAMFTYLAVINFVLAAFNLVPAFPLDGGRILRAMLWHFKKDLVSATLVASSFGSAFGFLLIVSGIFSLFSASAVGGLWQILIGFFVLNASRSSYQQLLISNALRGQTVRTLMTKTVRTADPNDSVQQVIEDVILKHNVTFVPVTEGEHVLGFVSTQILQEIERENRAQTKVGDVYESSSGKNTVSPDLSMEAVFTKMVKGDLRKLMVAENGVLLGVVALADLTTYLSIRNGLGLDIQDNEVLAPSGAKISA